MKEKKRYYALDVLRGLSILLMIGHHLAIDLVMYGYASPKLIDNWVLSVFQPIFAACFIALSGASSRFSRSSAKRGIKILACALLVTLSTAIFSGGEMIIVFGILHFLGVASLLYHWLHRALDRINIPGWVWLAAFLVSRHFFPVLSSIRWLWPLGILHPDFASADYYPLLPWIFMYFFGVWLADRVRDQKMPAWFYRVRFPFFEGVSRYSLWIYLLHQPLFMLIFYVIS